jgi:hypothetical protein
MRRKLRQYLARLATDPDLFSEYVADPAASFERAGLSAEERALLLSGDQNRIYAALSADGPEPA